MGGGPKPYLTCPLRSLFLHAPLEKKYTNAALVVEQISGKPLKRNYDLGEGGTDLGSSSTKKNFYVSLPLP